MQGGEIKQIQIILQLLISKMQSEVMKIIPKITMFIQLKILNLLELNKLLKWSNLDARLLKKF